MKTSTLKLWQSILAGLMFAAGVGNLADVVPLRVAAVFILIVGALSAGTGFYTAQVSTSPADVGAQSRGTLYRG